MNMLSSQMPEDQRICEIHQLKVTAIDLDLSNNGLICYLCSNCLIEKMNNKKISTIKQTKERIQSFKAQKQEKKNQIILNNIRIVLNNNVINYGVQIIRDLKSIYNKNTTIEEEQYFSQENFQAPLNFIYDVQLSQFISTSKNQMNFKKIFNLQMKFVNNLSSLLIMEHTAKFFQLQRVLNRKQQKLIKLKYCLFNVKIIKKHQIQRSFVKYMIIDSKNKKLKDRFACGECICDNLQCKYSTIEKVNQSWNDKIKQQDKLINELKVKKQKKQEKLNEKINKMRKNCNQQLNKISEKLLSELTQPIIQTNEIIQFKQTNLEQFSNDELFKNINYLIQQQDRENLTQYSKIDNMMTSDSLFFKVIENKFEQLKQHDLINIQESINSLLEKSNENQLQGIILISQQIQESTKANQEQLMRKQELDEFISSSKQIYCQMDIFNQTISQFQKNLKQINSIKDKIKSVSEHQHFINLEKQFQDYQEQCEQDFQELKKFCEMEEIIKKLQLDYKLLQQKENKQKTKIKELDALIKDIQIKLTNKKDDYDIQNENLKKEKIIMLNVNKHNKMKLNYFKKSLKIRMTNLEQFNQSLINQDQIQNLIYFKIITGQNYSKFQNYKLLKKQKFSFILLRNKNGLESQQFRKYMNGRDNLLMIFQSKSDQIFGAYFPCKWKSCNGKFVQDNTLSSFMFPQNHDQVYPLKQNQKEYAIYCNSQLEPTLCYGHIGIDSNFSFCYSRLGRSYQFDQFNQKQDFLDDENDKEQEDNENEEDNEDNEDCENNQYLFGQMNPEIIEM
ncbi:unnamed protein product [Paramecium primaurelia]|uniref:TLDc domain-containing protein n=1 Tax=Paramecium primaurelia TaxID=5886 RepID=A0A8S1L7F3_PARPR|nr:unnamed protein product [Paramecium primaurelia]